jgi:hypothetical protein
LPGVAGRLAVANGVVGVAEVGEAGRFEIVVAEVAVQVEGEMEAGDGLVMVAQVVTA